MQEEIFKRYGKYIAFAIFTFGGSALTLYSRFQMTEIEIENIEEKPLHLILWKLRWGFVLCLNLLIVKVNILNWF